MDRLRFIQNFNKLCIPSNPDRHWDSSSIVEGTFKHFGLLKWFSEWDLDSVEMPGKQTHDGEATAALNAVPCNRNCLKSTKYSWFQFSSPFVVWKSGFDSRRMCNKRFFTAVPAYPITGKLLGLKPAITCKHFLQPPPPRFFTRALWVQGWGTSALPCLPQSNTRCWGLAPAEAE